MQEIGRMTGMRTLRERNTGKGTYRKRRIDDRKQ